MIPSLSRIRLPVLLVIFFTCTSAVAGTAGSYFAVIVRDIDVSAAWYSETFDLQVVSRLDQAGRFEIVNLGKPGLFVELLELETAAAKPAGRSEGLFKAGILVADLDAFVAGLPPAGEPPEIIADARNGLRLVQLRDPDGNVIQVMQLQQAAPGSD